MNHWTELANAIVEQAARDFERYLCEDHECSTRETRANLREVRSYFQGNDIKTHTRLDGVELMEAIERNVIEHNYDLKALSKARSEGSK